MTMRYHLCFLSYIWRHLYKRATCMKTERIGTLVALKVKP